MKSLLFLVLILGACAANSQSFKGKPTGKERLPSSNAAFEQEVLRLVNKHRKKRGRQPLAWNDKLAYAARYHAVDMAKDGYFDHATKDRKGKKRHKEVCDLFERMDLFVGKSMFSRAENIAAGMNSPKEVVDEWMNSRTHRKNILDKEAKYLGVGFIRLEGSPYETYWVQSFGM